MAVGASAFQVRWMVLRQGASQICVGLLVGLVLAWGVSAVIQAMLFEVEPRDPSVFGTVVAMTLLVGLVASWVPAQRATRADPVTVMRSG